MRRHAQLHSGLKAITEEHAASMPIYAIDNADSAYIGSTE